MALVTTANRTLYSAALREVYTPKMWKLQNRDRILLQKFNKNTEAWAEGNQINIPLHTAGSGGVGYSSAGTLPTPNQQLTARATTNYKRLYARFRIDGALLKSTRTGYAAEMRALDFEAKNLIEDVADALAYDIWQDGSGQVSGAPTSPGGTPSETAFSVPKANCGIKRNMIIDVVTTADGVISTEGVLKALVVSVVTDPNDATRNLVTLDAATPLIGDFDISSGYGIYRQGSYDDAISGMSNIVSASGTYLGIDRSVAANNFWKAQVLSNGGTLRPLKLDLMQEMVDTIEQNSPGTTRLIVTNHALWRDLAGQLVADKRYNGNTMKLNGWCEALDFRGIPVVRDKYALANKMWFLDTETWTIYHDSEGGFIDEDGQILKQVADSDRFEAGWRRYLQIVSGDPASNGLLSDLQQ